MIVRIMLEVLCNRGQSKRPGAVPMDMSCIVMVDFTPVSAGMLCTVCSGSTLTRHIRGDKMQGWPYGVSAAQCA